MNKIKDYLYVFQLEEYDIFHFKRWVKINTNLDNLSKKKQLKWTLKVKLLYAISLVIDFITFHKIPEKSIIYANYFILIPEYVLKELIIISAKIKILTRKDLLVIGVTGSFGKTSVKEILAYFLSSKYKILKTPESYNTTLGVSRVILKELKREHQIFIVEMGAYKKNDINKLCNIVKPKIGIITAIGKQHLERFENEKNILETKFELASSLPKEGVLFLNGNDEKIVSYAKKYSNIKIKYFGLDKKNSNKELVILDTYASEIKISNNNISFILHSGGEERKIITNLFGKHNVFNITASSSVANHLGIDLEKISELSPTIPSIPHRMQIIPGANNTTVIDDSFNANPQSVKAALSVLSEFPSDLKIIITPGIVELGKDQVRENKIMGEEMAKIANYIIVVGETNKEALVFGMQTGKEKNPDVRFYEVKNLNEAMKILPEIVLPGSVILFENDLPDQYS